MRIKTHLISKALPRPVLCSVVLVRWSCRRGSDSAGPAPPQDRNVTVDPGMLSSLSFRHLSVFSRGGRVTAVTGVPSDQQLYYMGTTGGGVWKTTNAGRRGRTSRRLLRCGLDRRDRGVRIESERHLRRHRVGVPARQRFAGHWDVQVHRRRQTWQLIGLPNAGSIGRIVIHPTNPDLVYVAVLGDLFGADDERGVYRSRDGGTTWERVHFISSRPAPWI